MECLLCRIWVPSLAKLRSRLSWNPSTLRRHHKKDSRQSKGKMSSQKSTRFAIEGLQRSTQYKVVSGSTATLDLKAVTTTLANPAHDVMHFSPRICPGAVSALLFAVLLLACITLTWVSLQSTPPGCNGVPQQTQPQGTSHCDMDRNSMACSSSTSGTLQPVMGHHCARLCVDTE